MDKFTQWAKIMFENGKNSPTWQDTISENGFMIRYARGLYFLLYNIAYVTNDTLSNAEIETKVQELFLSVAPFMVDLENLVASSLIQTENGPKLDFSPELLLELVEKHKSCNPNFYDIIEPILCDPKKLQTIAEYVHAKQLQNLSFGFILPKSEQQSKIENWNHQYGLETLYYYTKKVVDETYPDKSSGGLNSQYRYSTAKLYPFLKDLSELLHKKYDASVFSTGRKSSLYREAVKGHHGLIYCIDETEFRTLCEKHEDCHKQFYSIIAPIFSSEKNYSSFVSNVCQDLRSWYDDPFAVIYNEDHFKKVLTEKLETKHKNSTK